jgi:myosin heavy subunit
VALTPQVSVLPSSKFSVLPRNSVEDVDDVCDGEHLDELNVVHTITTRFRAKKIYVCPPI